jgi:hypothetical protein
LECWFGFGNREFQVEGEEIIERVGGIGAWAKVREDNHIPEVPKGTSVLIIVLPRVSGAKAALTLGYFYDAATRHAPLTANAVNGFSFVGAGVCGCMTWWDEKRGLCGEHSPLMGVKWRGICYLTMNFLPFAM